jgi:hypothetical protein
MPDYRACRRPGCSRECPPQKNRGRKPYCNVFCARWHRAFLAFNESGAAPGRDDTTDAVLFAGLLSLGLNDGTAPVVFELAEAYRRNQ